jgi:hypothetical protein
MKAGILVSEGEPPIARTGSSTPFSAIAAISDLHRVAAVSPSTVAAYRKPTLTLPRLRRGNKPAENLALQRCKWLAKSPWLRAVRCGSRNVPTTVVSTRSKSSLHPRRGSTAKEENEGDLAYIGSDWVTVPVTLESSAARTAFASSAGRNGLRSNGASPSTDSSAADSA